VDCQAELSRLDRQTLVGKPDIRVIDRIRIPTLIIHAEDDPFIPFAPMRDPALVNNPYILLVATKKGGHVAFISAKASEAKLTAQDMTNSEANHDSRFTIHS